MADVRTPRYSRFVIAGAVLGALGGGAVSLVRPAAGQHSQGQVLLYTAIVVGVLGAMLGGLVAAALDGGARADPQKAPARTADPDPAADESPGSEQASRQAP